MSRDDEIVIHAAFLGHERGGRRRPPTMLSSGQYRPHLLLDGAALSTGLLGVQFIAGPDDVAPDEPFTATVRCVYPEVDASGFVVGARFAIHEGSRKVGDGVVRARRFVKEQP